MGQTNRFEIQEFGTERYTSVEDAQEAALGPLAHSLAEMIRSRLDNGTLIVEDGQVKLQREVDHEWK